MNFHRHIYQKLIVYCAMAMCSCMPAFAQSMEYADSLFYKREYATAFRLYDSIIALSQSARNIHTGNAYLRRGYIRAEWQEKTLALTDYFSALKIFEISGNAKRISAACTNIAHIYDEQDNLPEAKQYFQRAFDICLQENDSLRCGRLLNNLAIVAYKEGRKEKARSIHHYALHTYGDALGDEELCNHYLNLGNCFEGENDDSSLIYYTRAEEVASEMQDSVLLQRIYLNKGDVYKSRNNYTDALVYFNRSKNMVADFGDSTDLSLLYQKLSDTYFRLGLYKEAFEYSRQYAELNAQFYTADKSRFASELAEKYESGKKDEKIKSQDTENRLKSRNLLLSLAGLLLVALLAVVLWINYRRKKTANYYLQQQNDRIERLNRELEESNQVKSKLFSVISHDIRGPVSSIYAYLQMQNAAARSNNNSDVSNQTEQLLETLEDLLVWSKSQLHEFVPVETTFSLQQVIDQTITLHQPAMEANKLTVRCRVPGNLQLVTDINMFSIIIRNMLGNAIKHAVPGTVVEIAASAQQAEYAIAVTNIAQGGWTPGEEALSVSSGKSGLGITLIREFAQKSGGSIAYSNSGSGVTALLTLPFKKSISFRS